MMADAARTLERRTSDPEELRRALDVVEGIAGVLRDRPLPSDTACSRIWGLCGVARPYRSMLSPTGRALMDRFVGRTW